MKVNGNKVNLKSEPEIYIYSVGVCCNEINWTNSSPPVMSKQSIMLTQSLCCCCCFPCIPNALPQTCVLKI